jgi:hypothetical protein
MTPFHPLRGGLSLLLLHLRWIASSGIQEKRPSCEIVTDRGVLSILLGDLGRFQRAGGLSPLLSATQPEAKCRKLPSQGESHCPEAMQNSLQ